MKGCHSANIVTSATSFIKNQPTRPTREETEEMSIQEFQRKNYGETHRKERKRCNKEQMQHVKEAWLKRDQQAAEAKEQQKREQQR